MLVPSRSAPLLLTLLLAGCVTQQIDEPKTSWDLTADQPTLEMGVDPHDREPAEEVAASVPAPEQDADLLDLFTAATDDDLGADILGDELPSPFHRLGHNIIRGLDGSWTKIYSVRSGQADKVVRLMSHYVPAFPATPDVANDANLPPDEQIKYYVEAGFYRDETKDDIGVRLKLSDPAISDAIHVTAPPEVLLFIDELLKKVLADLPQIEIEILVVEVNLSDSIDWDSKVKIAQLEDRTLPYDAVTNPVQGAFGSGVPIVDDGQVDGSGAAFSSFPNGPVSLPGFLLSAQGVHNDYTVTGIISLLQTIGAAELLSSPKITVLNGHRARLTTGDKLPIFETKGTVNNPTVSTKFEPTGVSIELVPYIVADDLLRIDLSIDVSTQTGSEPLVLNGISVDSPIISQRTAGTTLHVYSDQTFALGGLKSTVQVEQLTKVPLLGDIPLLGWLFKSRSSTTRKTEILFLVKPTIRVPSETLLNPLRNEGSLIDPGGLDPGLR
ncbi:MAG: hypothetical protein DRQ55_04020 [Planctomycetota bacterium]|nr:MAG: hypothetical protein DRQ55_04020 [Planctomycetota bacterium]